MRAWIATTLLVVVLGCNRTGPEAVGDRFVDLAIAGFDQRAALELADGHAKRLLERELRLIGESRGSSSWQDHSNQSSIYYDRGKPRKLAGGRVQIPYVLTIHGGGERRMSLTLEERDGTWKVVDYETREGG